MHISLEALEDSGCAMQDQKAETSLLLGPQQWPSRSRAHRYMTQTVRVRNAYIPLLVCCFITGLIDAASYSAWSVFMGMQTGNTIFLALSTANLPSGTDDLKWARSGISILSLMVGSMITARIYTAVGATRRLTLLVSFFLQALCIATAALLVHINAVPDSTLENKRVFVAIPFLAAQSGAQIVTAKALGFTEIPTTVLTSTYNDLASDTELFSGRNLKRNRRIASIIMILLGAISGGWLVRLGNSLTLVLWVGVGLKLLGMEASDERTALNERIPLQIIKNPVKAGDFTGCGSSSTHATRQRLVENITLLWTLNEIPEEPKYNIPPRDDDGTRQLTLERERQVADSFAFISAPTDNMLRVMAVSIEEDADRNGMTIRLASNTGNLSSMKEALGNIAKTLEKAASRIDSRIAIRLELFKQIVTLDKPRILSRLRSRHAVVTSKTAGKPGLMALLSRTINDPSIKASGKSAEDKVARARSQTKRIVEAFNKFETEYDVGDPSLSEEKLVDVLIQAYEFDVENLQVALQTPSLVNPSVVTFLSQAISKLGRYYCVMCDLINAARSSQYSIFRRVSIKVLEEPILETHSITKGLLDFNGSVGRLSGMPPQRQVNRYGSESLSLARTKYNARISSLLPPWKVHAEIQLLLFYEHNNDICPPRFICSSKSACYLCDSFVKLHGRFHLPRTHGRLYDRWILPEWSVRQSQSVQIAIDRLNATLEGKILQTLSSKRPPFYPPNESVLHLREPWSSNSTLPAIQTRHSITEPSDDGKATKELDEITLTDSADDGFPSGTVFERQDAKSAESAKSSAESVTPIANQVLEEERRRCVSPLGSSVRLRSQGDTVCHKLTRPRDTLVVRTDAITLYASSDWSPTDSSESATSASTAQNDCWVQVTWLSHSSHIASGDPAVDIVDLDTLSSIPDDVRETTLEGGSVYSEKALCVRKGGHVLVINYSLHDPHCE